MDSDLVRYVVPVMENSMAQSFLALQFIEEMIEHGLYRTTNLETKSAAVWAKSQLEILRK